MNDPRLQNILELMQELLPILLNDDEEVGGGESGGIEALMGGEDGEVVPGKAVSIEIAEPIEDDDFETEAALAEADPDIDGEDEDKELYRSMLRNLK